MAQDETPVSARDTSRIDPLRNNPIDWTGQDLIDATFPRSWPIFGTKARMAIGGYVKVDYIQDFSGTHNDRFELLIQNVPVEGTPRYGEGPYMNLFARETRFNLDIRTQTSNATPLRVFIEMDFWNLDRSPFNSVPRLRHSYGVVGSFLVGRTWGTLTDVYSIPATIDFAAGDAISGSRRPQIRLERPLSDNTNWAVGLEMLEFPDIDNVADQAGKASQLFPLIAGRITHEFDSGGRFMFGGSAFQLRWDGTGGGPDASTLGWGLLFSGRKYLGSKDYFIWNISAGGGWGSNIVSQLGSGFAAVLTPGGSVEPIFSYNVSAGFAHELSKTLEMNVHGAWQALESVELKQTYDLREGGTAHANLVWSPEKSINLGVEYGLGYRKTQSGSDGTAHRAQAMVKFIF